MSRIRLQLVLIGIFSCLLSLSCGTPPQGDGSSAGEPVTLTVFAAASLTEVLEITGGAWQEETGNTLEFNFASSGSLARQLIEGAAADLFISANREWMDALVEKGLVDAAAVVPFAGNSLVVIAAEDSPLTLTNLEEIVDFVAGGIAIGDPEHVPAGQYAREALTACGAWPALENTAIRAVDVRAALAYVQRKEVALGIVFATDALATGVKVLFEVPAELHTPAIYYAAPLRKGQGKSVAAWLAFMRAPEQARGLAAIGFMPTEQ